MCDLETFFLTIITLMVCVLALYSVRGWLLLMNEERRKSTCPRCGLAITIDKSAAVARPIRRCPHCGTEADPLQVSASGWINSTLRPPE